jgi:hypothetical protein
MTQPDYEQKRDNNVPLMSEAVILLHVLILYLINL